MTAEFSNARCLVCDRAIAVTRHGNDDTCDNARCRLQQSIRAGRVDAGRSMANRARLAAVRDRLAPRVGVPPGPLPVAVLPVLERGITKLPRERYEAFRRQLTESVRQATASMNTDKDGTCKHVRPVDSAPSAVQQRVMSRGCATCRGHCCKWGGDHAFLYPAQLRKKLRANPDLSADDLLAHYLGKIPTHSVEDSCVFHTAHGCALERHDRSERCNDFFCRGMSELWHSLSCGGSLRAFVGAATDQQFVRFAVIDEQGATSYGPDERPERS